MTSAPKPRPTAITRWSTAWRSAAAERAGRGEHGRVQAERARLDLEQGVALERARPEGVEEQHTDRQERERECAEAGEEEREDGRGSAAAARGSGAAAAGRATARPDRARRRGRERRARRWIRRESMGLSVVGAGATREPSPARLRTVRGDPSRPSLPGDHSRAVPDRSEEPAPCRRRTRCTHAEQALFGAVVAAVLVAVGAAEPAAAQGQARVRAGGERPHASRSTRRRRTATRACSWSSARAASAS